MLKFEIERLRDAAFSIDTDRLLTPISHKHARVYERIPEDVIETEADLIEKSIKDLQDIEEVNDDNDEEVCSFVLDLIPSEYESLLYNYEYRSMKDHSQFTQMIDRSNLLPQICVSLTCVKRVFRFWKLRFRST